MSDRVFRVDDGEDWVRSALEIASGRRLRLKSSEGLMRRYCRS